MCASLQPSAAEALSGIWAALHKDLELSICESQVHYLGTMAVLHDDDLVSQLLLKKLRLARVLPAENMPSRIITMNSFVEYSYDGGPASFGQIVHPSAVLSSYGIAVTDAIGAGLLGLEPRQTILWPDLHGEFRELSVLHVENCSGMHSWLQGDAR